jgi:hypothetical protein
VDTAVPSVEIAHDADTGAIGSPHAKVDAGARPDMRDMSAKLVVDARVLAFAEQIEIVIADDPAVAIWIVDLGGVDRRGR